MSKRKVYTAFAGGVLIGAVLVYGTLAVIAAVLAGLLHWALPVLPWEAIFRVLAVVLWLAMVPASIRGCVKTLRQVREQYLT